jgi:hypothetical protein
LLSNTCNLCRYVAGTSNPDKLLDLWENRAARMEATQKNKEYLDSVILKKRKQAEDYQKVGRETAFALCVCACVCVCVCVCVYVCGVELQKRPAMQQQRQRRTLLFGRKALDQS